MRADNDLLRTIRAQLGENAALAWAVSVAMTAGLTAWVLDLLARLP